MKTKKNLLLSLFYANPQESIATKMKLISADRISKDRMAIEACSEPELLCEVLSNELKTWRGDSDMPHFQEVMLFLERLSLLSPQEVGKYFDEELIKYIFRVVRSSGYLYPRDEVYTHYT